MNAEIFFARVPFRTLAVITLHNFLSRVTLSTVSPFAKDPLAPGCQLRDCLPLAISIVLGIGEPTSNFSKVHYTFLPPLWVKE